MKIETSMGAASGAICTGTGLDSIRPAPCLRRMPKYSETVLIHDHKVRTARAYTLEVTGPQSVIDALEEGCLNMEILANAVADVRDRKCMLEVWVIQKDRNGKKVRPKQPI